MKLLTIISLLFMFGCGELVAAPAKYFGEPTDITKYLEKLNEDLTLIGSSPINVDHIKFYSQKTGDGSYIGLCSKGSDGIKISLVEPDSDFSWYTYYIFVHEIGHCYFNKRHMNGPYIMNPTPHAIMSTEFISDSGRLGLLVQMLNQ